MTVELLTANHAAATAATLAGRANRSARGFGGGLYPITPQSESIEFLCKQTFDRGELVRVEPHPLHWTRDGLRVKKAVERLLDARQVDVVLGFYNEAAHLPELCAERGGSSRPTEYGNLQAEAHGDLPSGTAVPPLPPGLGAGAAG